MPNVRQRKVTRIAFLVFVFSMFGKAARMDALIIGINDISWNWINQYAVGMCDDQFKDQRFMTWQQVKETANQIQLRVGEPVCVIGHGAAGYIGDVTGQELAATIRDKVTPGAGTRVLLMACSSAVQPEGGGQSVLDEFVRERGQEKWRGLTVFGSLGSCVADRNGERPLLRVVLLPLAPFELCSYSELKVVQGDLQLKVEGNIKACQEHHRGNDLLIGRCLYDLQNQDGSAIEENFYIPFLRYIKENGCAYPGRAGVKEATMQ